MSFSKAVAMRTMQLLMNRDMSQYKLLKKTGLSQSTWQNIIKEKQTDIKLSTVSLLASAFDMTLKDFFDDKIFERKDLDF